MTTYAEAAGPSAEIESAYAWVRLATALALGTIGCVGMWSFVVALPAVQADFGIARGEASVPYTLLMIGFAIGSIVTGRLSDRFGITATLAVGAVAIGLGYIGAGFASQLWQLTVAYALLGVGTSAGFGPLIADISHWFER